jgi:acyl-CoA dehydrogenase
VLRNFPMRGVAAFMRLMIFPRGLTYFAPADRMGRKVADLVLNAGASRDRLCQGVYRTVQPANPLGLLQAALELAPRAELIEKKIRVAGVKAGTVTALDLPGQIDQALAQNLISAEEGQFLRSFDGRVMDIINVDDFDSAELGHQP